MNGNFFNYENRSYDPYDLSQVALAFLSDPHLEEYTPPDPYSMCAALLKLLPEDDRVFNFLYSECQLKMPGIFSDHGCIIGKECLAAFFAEDEVKEFRALLEWRSLLMYARAAGQKEGESELEAIKRFLKIHSLYEILKPPNSFFYDASELTFNQFLERLAPFFESQDDLLQDASLSFRMFSLVANDVANIADAELLKTIEEFDGFDEFLVESLNEFFRCQTFEFKLRFVLISKMLCNLIKEENDYSKIIYELDIACLQFFESPLHDVFSHFRSVFEKCHEIFSTQGKLTSFASGRVSFPKFAKLDVAGHPNWMPNGGNSCYISSTLWSLFLVIDSEIRKKIRSFETNPDGLFNDLFPAMKEAKETFASFYTKVASDAIEDIQLQDVNTFRRALQLSCPDQFMPNTFLQEDAYDFLVWVLSDLLGFHVKREGDPKFFVMHTFCRTTEEELLEETQYDYREALAPSYNPQPSYILDLRLDEGVTHRTSLDELMTSPRKTENVERNAYKIGNTEGPKYRTIPTDHNELILVESEESAPQFFVGRVARFTLDLQRGVKRKRFDQITPNASLGFKIKGREDENERVFYDLIAITVHSGYTIDSGHYYTYFRSEVKGVWQFFKYDDIKGPSFCDGSQAMMDAAENGYLYYYRKRGEDKSPPPLLPFEDLKISGSDDLKSESKRDLPSILSPLGSGSTIPAQTTSIELTEASQWLEENLPGEFSIGEGNSYFSIISDLLRQLEVTQGENEGLHELALKIEQPIYVLDPSRDTDLIVLDQQISIPGEQFRFGEGFTGNIFYIFKLKSGAFMPLKKIT